MFARIEKATQSLNEGVQKLRKRADQTRRYLRDDFPMQCVGGAARVLGKAQGHLKRAHEQMVVDFMCSDRVSAEDLGDLWGLDYPDIPQHLTDQGIPEVREHFGLPPHTRSYSGSFGGSDVATVGKVLAKHTQVRDNAREKGQKAAEAHREALEVARQERIEGLARRLTEALEDKLEGASLPEVLIHIFKANILAWEAVQEGDFNPRTPLGKLLVMESLRLEREEASMESEPASSEPPQEESSVVAELKELHGSEVVAEIRAVMDARGRLRPVTIDEQGRSNPVFREELEEIVPEEHRRGVEEMDRELEGLEEE